MLKNIKRNVKVCKLPFWRFSRFKPLRVLLCIIVHRKGNDANFGLEIAKNGYFCGFLETYLFGEPFWRILEQSFLCMDKCLKSPFICSFFVYRCRFAFMVAFVQNRMDLLFFSESVSVKPPVWLICLICFASLHPFESIGNCCL